MVSFIHSLTHSGTVTESHPRSLYNSIIELSDSVLSFGVGRGWEGAGTVLYGHLDKIH